MCESERESNYMHIQPLIISTEVKRQMKGMVDNNRVLVRFSGTNSQQKSTLADGPINKS